MTPDTALPSEADPVEDVRTVTSSPVFDFVVLFSVTVLVALVGVAVLVP